MKSSNGIDGQSERSRFWRKHVEGWSRGGATQVGYCRRHKLKLPAFGYWKRKLAAVGRAKNQEPAPAEFVEVRLRKDATPVGKTGRGGLSGNSDSSPLSPYATASRGASWPSTSNIKLLIRDEFAIEVGDGFSPDALRSLVLGITATSTFDLDTSMPTYNFDSLIDLCSLPRNAGSFYRPCQLFGL